MNSVWLQKMKKRQAGDGDSNADAASAVPAAVQSTTKRAHVDSRADASAVAPQQQQSSMKRARVDDSSADASAVAPQSTKRTRVDASSSTASVAPTTTEEEDLRLPPSLASPPLQTCCRAADLQTSSSAVSAPDNLRRDDSPVPPTEIVDRRLSCTPTEIEISSSDSEDDLPETVMPYKRWTNMKARVRAVLKAGFTPSHEVVFDLASPCQAWQPHIDYIVNTGLSVRNVTHFKIGISYTPHKRFYYDDYRLLRRMVVCLVTEDCDLTAQAEIDAIKRYRSDRRCRNVSPGGESHDHDVSPHFLYVVFGNICQFPPKRREPYKAR